MAHPAGAYRWRPVTSRAGYWIGGALVVAAVVGALAYGFLSFRGIDRSVDDFVRVAAPGSRTVQLEQREYVVYFEGPGADEDEVPPIDVAITAAPSGRRLPIEPYEDSLTYSLRGHSGTAQGTVTAPRAGRYVVSARTALRPSARVGVALGPSLGGRVVRAILVSVAIAALLAVAGFGLFGTTMVRRMRRRAAARSPAADGGS